MKSDQLLLPADAVDIDEEVRRAAAAVPPGLASGTPAERLETTFGSGSSAQALLESSLDGQRFREEARGRAADSRLRELLRWGLEAPGGRGGARGLPESFLSHVLLAAQGTVVQILERTLTEDRDGSGRERLHEPVQRLRGAGRQDDHDPRAGRAAARPQDRGVPPRRRCLQ